ncbi:MAG: disulfide bond formation protein B [Burkholderiales bacterium]
MAARPTGKAHAVRAAAQAPVRPVAVSAEAGSDAAWALVFAVWLLATASTLGALFFSEVMELPPCVLCWYQRIFMFPLVLLLPLGLFPFDGRVVRYTLPLAAGGWLISVFQLLLVWGLVPEGLRPCTQGVPCSEVQIRWLGFVSIPLLSFVAFTSMVALLVAARARISR